MAGKETCKVKRNVQKIKWKTLLRLGISAGIIALLLSQIDLRAVLDVISRINPLAVVLALASGVAASVCAGMAWAALLGAQGIHLPVWQTLRMHFVGLFFAAFTPGGLGGDVARTVRVRQHTGKTVEGGATVIASRVISLLTLAGMAALAAILRADGALRRPALIALGALVLGTAAFWLMEQPVMKILSSGPATTPAPFARFTRIMREVFGSLYQFKKTPGALARSGAWMLAYQVFGVLPIYLLARGMSLPMQLLDALSLGAMARFTAFLPISISGVGVQEGAFVFLFAPLGIAASQALALSLLDHVVLTLVPLVGGALYALDE